MNPDANGWYRVHANDGSGLDYSTTAHDPERHVLVVEAASDEFGRPYPPTTAVVEETLEVAGLPEVVETPEVVPRTTGKPKTEDKTPKAEEANA